MNPDLIRRLLMHHAQQAEIFRRAARHAWIETPEAYFARAREHDGFVAGLAALVDDAVAAQEILKGLAPFSASFTPALKS
ncbi:hypothetical protein OpiT1DRAFT_04003 [Opitutaceae bacterium TAV1]|nr:hypothetical protein OpiT1DRAFT_04003 [Opitutaceae bacterium TAV1]